MATIEEIMRKAEEAKREQGGAKEAENEERKVEEGVANVYAEREKQVQAEQRRQEAEALQKKLAEQKEIDEARKEALRRDLGLDTEKASALSAELQKGENAEAAIRAMKLDSEQEGELLAELRKTTGDVREQEGSIKEQNAEKESYVAATESAIGEVGDRESVARQAQADAAESIETVNEAAASIPEPVMDRLHEDALTINEKVDREKEFEMIKAEEKSAALIGLAKGTIDSFYKIPSDLQNDKDVVLMALRLGGKGLDLLNVPYSLKGDKDVIATAVGKDGRDLKYVPPDAVDKNLVMLAAQTSPDSALYYASGEIGKDRDVILTAISKDAGVLRGRQLPDWVYQDKEVIQDVVKQVSQMEGWHFDDLPKAIRENPEVALARKEFLREKEMEEIKKDIDASLEYGKINSRDLDPRQNELVEDSIPLGKMEPLESIVSRYSGLTKDHPANEVKDALLTVMHDRINKNAGVSDAEAAITEYLPKLKGDVEGLTKAIESIDEMTGQYEAARERFNNLVNGDAFQKAFEASGFKEAQLRLAGGSEDIRKLGLGLSSIIFDAAGVPSSDFDAMRESVRYVRSFVESPSGKKNNPAEKALEVLTSHEFREVPDGSALNNWLKGAGDILNAAADAFEQTGSIDKMIEAGAAMRNEMPSAAQLMKENTTPSFVSKVGDAYPGIVRRNENGYLYPTSINDLEAAMSDGLGRLKSKVQPVINGLDSNFDSLWAKEVASQIPA